MVHILPSMGESERQRLLASACPTVTGEFTTGHTFGHIWGKFRRFNIKDDTYKLIPRDKQANGVLTPDTICVAIQFNDIISLMKCLLWADGFINQSSPWKQMSKLALIRESAWAVDETFGLEGDWNMAICRAPALKKAYFKIVEFLDFQNSAEGKKAIDEEMGKITRKTLRTRAKKSAETGVKLPYFEIKRWHTLELIVRLIQKIKHV